MSVSEGPDRRVALLAQRQHGAFSRSQAIQLGVGRTAVQRRVASGRWRRAAPGVYVVGGTPASWLLDVWVAYLAVGPPGAVTHETALLLHRVPELPRKPITLTVPRSHHLRVPDAVVHQIGDLKPHHLTTVAGLSVSRPARAAVEVAATLGKRRLASVVDDVVAARLCTYLDIVACFREVARPGKPGMAKLAEVLDDRGKGYVPAQSRLEEELFAALAAGGLPAPRRQFPLPGAGRIEGCVDAAYPEARVILEADGRRWHTRLKDLKRDHQRDAEAARAGWITLRFVYEQIVGSPAEVCATVSDVLDRRIPTLPREAIGPVAPSRRQ